MPTFSGRVTIEGAGKPWDTPAACAIGWDAERLSLVPSSGPAVIVDLGDIDALAEGALDLVLDLWSGRRVRIDRLGKVHDRVARELGDAWRDRTARCLVLHDLREVDRFSGHVRIEGPSPAAPQQADLRLCESNLVVLPAGGSAFHWRLADLDRASFDEQAYAWRLESGSARLVVSRLAKRTSEFGEKLREASVVVSRRSAEGLQRAFPFLDADQMGRLSSAWREGAAVSLSMLSGIDLRLADSLRAGVVAPRLRPYVDDLFSRSGAGRTLAGFVLRPPGQIDEDEPNEEPGGADALPEPVPLDSRDTAPAGADSSDLQPVFWLLFELPPAPGRSRGLVAWETVSAAGRATYLFDWTGDVQALNRALVALNLRREPIFLSDDRLASDARFVRHAIAIRRMPVLRALRRSFAGRAVHASLDGWCRQLSAVTAAAP